MRFEVFMATRIFFLWAMAQCGFGPEDGVSMLLRNVGIHRQIYTAPKSRRRKSLITFLLVIDLINLIFVDF